MMQESQFFVELLRRASEAWFQVICSNGNDTPARDDVLKFFIPEGFPHIDRVPGSWAYGVSSAEGFALSLAYFRRYLHVHQGDRGNTASRMIAQKITAYYPDDGVCSEIDEVADDFFVESSESWSEGVAVIEDDEDSHWREDSHRAAVVYLGSPTCSPEQIVSYDIPLATLFSSMNDSMTIFSGMDGDEFRQKMLLWVIAVHRRAEIDWDIFLEDYPAMRAVVCYIQLMCELLAAPKDHFKIMDSDGVCAISLASQRKDRMIWGYSHPEEEADGHRSGDTTEDADTYLAMQHYVPGRDC